MGGHREERTIHKNPFFCLPSLVVLCTLQLCVMNSSTYYTVVNIFDKMNLSALNRICLVLRIQID